MSNLDLYNAVRNVPEEAKKPIAAGRLKGYTDINPMWRIKTLTEQFGPVGFGWYYKIINQRLEPGADNTVTSHVEIELYVKMNGEWSMPIVGIGGSQYITKERNGMYTDDECFKKALTDAISVACKALGIGADVYWGSDRTKYTSTNNAENAKENSANAKEDVSNAETMKINAPKWAALTSLAKKKGVDYVTILKKLGLRNGSEMTMKTWMEQMEILNKMEDIANE